MPARNGQADDTLMVFTSDNGGERFSDNWPLVGGKMDLTEGGIRVPWIARWPAKIAPGGVSQQHCMTMDWSATLLEAADVKAAHEPPRPAGAARAAAAGPDAGGMGSVECDDAPIPEDETVSLGFGSKDMPQR